MLRNVAAACAIFTLGVVNLVRADCIGLMAPIVLYDMHDGDMKQIEADGFVFRILPYNNSQTWAVYGNFDVNCVARVNFSVPGKPNPPPINLTMTMWLMESTDIRLNKMGFEFTDPTGTLGPADKPLNFWVMNKWPKPVKGMGPSRFSSKGKEGATGLSSQCLESETIVNDMHDGDEKDLATDRSGKLRITPYHNDQKWSVDATFNQQCVATVDFQVPGKPNPPPNPLAARVWGMESIAGASKNVLEFTDPTGTLAPSDQPLNIWSPNNAKK